MAQVVSESENLSFLFDEGEGEDRIRKFQEYIYETIYDYLGFSKERFQRAFDLDFRSFQYYLMKSPIYTKKKVKFLEKLLEKLKNDYPIDPEFNRELEEFICFLKEYGKRSKNTSQEQG